MTFYTYAYIVQHSHFDSMLQYAVSFVLLAAFLFALFKYFRHRLVTRYRDLVVILFLALLFAGGLQYTEYSRTESDAEAATHVAGFLRGVAQQEGVSPDEIRANTTQIRPGMLLWLRDAYYEVDFDADFAAYTLKQVHLVNDNVKVVDKDI